MAKYIISACLAGIDCKYNGGNNLKSKIAELLKTGNAVLICPEQQGGLPTPRIASEIKGDKVFSKTGEDVTRHFKKGAEIALKIAELSGADTAILKERSPSCGVNYVYDGTHSGNVIKGQGFTTRLLKTHGIKIISEEEFLSKDIVK